MQEDVKRSSAAASQIAECVKYEKEDGLIPHGQPKPTGWKLVAFW
jgi:hypothetical protein